MRRGLGWNRLFGGQGTTESLKRVHVSPGREGKTMTGISVESLTPLLLSTAASVIQSGFRIGVILIAGYVGSRLLRIAWSRLESILIKAGEATETVPGATRKRVTTLIGLLRTSTVVLLWAVIVVMALGQIGLDITPILAGAGIIGLAASNGLRMLAIAVVGPCLSAAEAQKDAPRSVQAY
jgi:hypothetical protein